MQRRELTREEIARLRHGVDRPALEELLAMVPPEDQEDLLHLVLRPIAPQPPRDTRPRQPGEALTPLWSYGFHRRRDTRFHDEDLQAQYERATRDMV